MTRSEIRFVAALPFAATRDPVGWAGNRSITDWAAAAEAAGFDAVAVTDHPFPSDAWLATGGHHALDPFVVLTAFAAATTRVRVVTDVLVAGYRSPFLLAKSIASTDVLSGGRLTVGIAAGYQEHEFEALGASFADRGKRFDEAVEAVDEALRGTTVSRRGGYFPVVANTMLPRPLQQPRPPIWIGGNAPAAMRRAVELGDGWMPFHQTPSRVAISKAPVLDSLDQLRERIAEAVALREGTGKPPLDICTSIFEADRDPGALVARVADYAAAGVTWIRVMPGGRTLDDAVARLEAIGAARATLTA